MGAYITLTNVIRHIEARLGLSHQVLEITQEDILEIIKQETLPTFSKYYPYMVNIDLLEGDKVPGKDSEYYIKTDLSIIGVEEMYSSGNVNSFNGYQHNTFLTDPISAKLSADVNSMYTHPELFRFHPPNRVEVIPQNFNRIGGITLKVMAVHPEHLMTIPLSLREIFLQLAFYDVCMVLYPIRYNYANMSTSFGSIDMFMEHLESANDNRKELLDSLQVDSLKYAKRRKIYIF